MNRLLLVLLLISKSALSLELVLVDAPIKEFVSWTAQQTTKNIILSESIKGNISVNAKFLNKSDLLQFFKESMVANGYQVVDAETSLIVTINDKPDLQGEYFTLETQLYHFENIKGARALEALETMMFSVSRDDSGSGQIYKISALANGNGVVVTTTKEMHDAIARFLPQVDVARKLVLIEAIIVEKQINENEEVGVDWDVMPEQKNGTTFKLHDLNINPSSGFLSLLNSGNIVAMVHALETQDNIDILSKPKLMTLDKQTASVVVGQDVPFVVGRTITDNDTSKQFQQIERRDVGLVLEFTPYIVGDQIHIQINQSISSVSSSTQAADLITNKRSINTVVSVKSGQLVTLGGLISKTSQDTVSGVPVLQDIPLIGSLFQSTSTEVKKTELSLILKARII